MRHGKHHFLGLGERGGDAIGMRSAALGEFGPAAALAADERRDGLDDFSRLDFFRELGRDGGEERDLAFLDGGEDDDALPLGLERVGEVGQVIGGLIVDDMDDDGDGGNLGRFGDEFDGIGGGLLLVGGFLLFHGFLFVLGALRGKVLEKQFAGLIVLPEGRQF